MTIGANPKAGMDSDEFSKYLKTTICPLYLDTSDAPLKRVVIPVDSGPSRVNEVMLAQLSLKGFYLIPGVPNTTHVTQGELDVSVRNLYILIYPHNPLLIQRLTGTMVNSSQCIERI